jgi:hypothetical protein
VGLFQAGETVGQFSVGGAGRDQPPPAAILRNRGFAGSLQTPKLACREGKRSLTLFLFELEHAQ